MKYVIMWKTPITMPEETLARAFKVFDAWYSRQGQSKSLNYHEMLGRVDNSGGFMVVETDDIAALTKEAALFTPYYDCNIFPVMEIANFAQAGREAVEFRASID